MTSTQSSVLCTSIHFGTTDCELEWTIIYSTEHRVVVFNNYCWALDGCLQTSQVEAFEKLA